MKKLNFISFSISLVLVIALFSCKSGKNGATPVGEKEVLPEDIVELREDQLKLAGIETGTVQLRSLSGSIKVNGLIAVAPQNLATVCMPLGGFVKRIQVLNGNYVVKGQTLAMLENHEFVDIQQSYLEIKSKLEYAEAEYKRHNALYKEDVYSQKNVQQVTAEYKGLKAQSKALEQKLLLIGINPAKLNEDGISSSVAVVAPISGYIKSVNVNIGKFVNPSDVLFEVINNDKLILELTLFEKDADKVATGQNIHFFINNETEQHEALITQTGKSIGSDKSCKVYAEVTGACKNTLPGMYVNAIIEASNQQVMSLPSGAIVSFDDKDYIFIFEKNKTEGGKLFTEYRMLKVQKGVSDASYTEIILPATFDIKPARIVIKGAYKLLSAKKNAGEMAC